MNNSQYSDEQGNNVLHENNKHILTPIPVVSEQEISDLHQALLKWLKKETGFLDKTGTSVTVKNATKFFTYRLLLTSKIVSREFQERMETTSRTHRSDGEELDKSSLWTTRKDLLNLEKLNEEGNTNFSIKINETSSIVPCIKCRTTGNITCPECNGNQEVTCPDCKGQGTYKDYADVECPKCHGTGLYYRHTCPVCGKNSTTRLLNMIDNTNGRAANTNEGSGTVRKLIDFQCERCEGSGKIMCPHCEGIGCVECPVCGGSGYLEKFWVIHQTLEKPESSISDFFDPALPIQLPAFPITKSMQGDVISTWKSLTGEIDSQEINDISGDVVCKIKSSIVASNSDLSSPDKKTIFQEANLFCFESCIKIEFEYHGKTYIAWMEAIKKKYAYEFQGNGFCAAWKRAKQKYLDGKSFFKKIFHKKENYLDLFPDDLSESEKENLSCELTELHRKIHQGKDPSCNTDADSNTISVYENSKVSITVKKQKKMDVYILLSIFLPSMHSFYIGSFVKGTIQLLLIILTGGIGLVLVWPWAVIESHIIKKDTKDFPLKPGSFWRRTIIEIVIITLIYCLFSFSSKDNKSKQPNNQHTDNVSRSQQVLQNNKPATAQDGTNTTSNSTPAIESKGVTKQNVPVVAPSTEKAVNAFEDNLLK